MSERDDDKKLSYFKDIKNENEKKNSYEENRRKELERIRKWIEERRKKRLEAEKNDKYKNEVNIDEKESNNQVNKTNPDINDKVVLEKENNIINKKKAPKEVIDEIKFERNRLLSLSNKSIDYAKVKLRLNYLENLPWETNPYVSIDIDNAKKTLDNEHYGMDEVKEEIIEYIYAINKLGKVSNEIILLSGPPGTGKTSIARQIAKALRREFYKIPLGGLNDEVFLKGASRQYAGAKPGAIVDILFKAGHRNLVILLDEVDKFGTKNGSQEAASALLDALDHDNSFVDRFIDLPIDLSDIIFVATANDSSKIPSALYDRMNPIEISPYTKSDKIAICKKHIIPKEKEKYQLDNNMLKIDSEVIGRIVDEDRENAGVRGISKKIKKICRVASKELQETGNKTYHMTEKNAISFNIISERIVHYIINSKVGKVTTSGIDYTNGKEALLNIESIFNEKRKESVALGAIKSKYEDDVTQFWSYIVANEEKLKIQENYINEGALVINVEELRRFKYDVNHRLSIFSSMYSSLTKVILPQKHLVVGNVSLLGEVKSDGKTYGHIINAINSGARVLIIPKDIKERVKTLINDENIVTFTISDLSEMRLLYNRFCIFNLINKYLANSDNQQSIETLMECEREIKLIVNEENKTLKEACYKYFNISNKQEKVPAEVQLEKLIGLKTVKSLINEVITWQVITNKRKEVGLKVKNIGLHMMFTGNPGTGKTIVAKILGKMLYEKKLVKNDKFIEVTRDDLVGKYIGHTEEKVKKIIQCSLGGVLYIDEAHSLYVDSSKDYGKIVLSTLVKEIEEHRENLIIIMSGYKKEMTEMIKLNPGLSDRINYKINFEDYSVSELTNIFISLCNEEDYEVDELSIKYFEELISSYLETKKEEFSNGRFVRNIFEKAKIKQAIRISKQENISIEDFKVIEIIDLELAFLEETKNKIDVDKEFTIGFNIE